MKAGWSTKRLDEVGILQRGFDLPAPQRTPGPYALVTSSGPTDTHVEAKVKGPGVATGRSGSIGNVFFVEGDYWPLNTALYVKDFHGNEPRFVYYLLQFIRLERFATGAGVPTLNRNDVHGELVTVPNSLDEQRRIVAILDEAFKGLDRARANAEANQASARELFEVRRAEIFSRDAEGEDVALGEVCTNFEYGTAAKSKPTGAIPVLRMGNLQDGEIDWSDLVYSDDEADCSRYLLRAGDVLFNRTNSPAHVGKTSIFDGTRPAIFAGYLIRVTPDKKRLRPEFLNHFLNSDIAREYGRSVMGTSVNQANISAGRLRGYRIRLPSVARQAELVDELDELKRAIKPLQATFRAKMRDVADLRQSLLQKAFAGELT